MDQAQPGSSFYSDVTLNRELGEVEGPAMLRLMRPIFDPGQRLIGVLVINADFEGLLHWAVPHVPDDVRILIVNSNLDYMVFDGSGALPHLIFHDSADWSPPPFVSLYTETPEIGPFSKLHRGVALSHLPISAWRNESAPNPLLAPTFGSTKMLAGIVPRAHLPFRLRLIVEMPRDRVFAASRAILSRNIGMALALAMVTIALSAILGTRVLAPLTRLTDTIRNHSDKSRPIDFAAPGDDEVGQLANELTQLSRDLIRETMRLDSILMTAADAIVTIDAKGVIVEANTATEALFGYSHDELIGAKVDLLMLPEDARAHGNHVATATPGEGPRKMGNGRELYGRHKNGDAISVEVSDQQCLLQRGPAFHRHHS